MRGVCRLFKVIHLLYILYSPAILLYSPAILPGNFVLNRRFAIEAAKL